MICPCEVRGMNAKPMSAILAAAFLTGILAGCHQEPGVPTVHVGMIAELSGDLPAVGASSRTAAELAVREINSAGGLATLHAHKAAILYDQSSEAPKSQSELFRTIFTEAGGTVVASETYTTGDKDFSAQLTKINQSAPDVVFLPAYYNDVPLVVQQA